MKNNLAENPKYQAISVLIPAVILLIMILLFDTNYEAYAIFRLLTTVIIGIILAVVAYYLRGKALYYFDIFKIVYIVLTVFLIFQTFLISPLRTSGTSMEPGIEDNDFLVGVVTKKFENQDVVIVNLHQEETFICKRIIGSAGDNVYFEDNQLYINDVAVDEPYISEDNFTFDFDLTDVAVSEGERLDVSNGIPEGYYLVLGDNRIVSKDSRSFGLVKEQDVLYRVIYNINKFERVS